MSAVPQPNREPSRANALMSEALSTRARDLAWVQESDEKIAAARHTAVVEFRWATEDERGAEIDVYYNVEEAIVVEAIKLTSIDDRPPTARERREYELQFWAEVEAAGDVWEQVASFIWERSHFQAGIERA